MSFEDDEHPREALSSAPKRPQGWRETARADGWRGALVPSSRPLWFGGFALAWAFFRLALTARSTTSLVVTTSLVLAFFIYVGVMRKRRWSFAVEDGRFRADARGDHYDVALEEILRFEAEKSRRGGDDSLSPQKLAPFQLVVHRAAGDKLRVPLFVDDAGEAQFIADRANDLLARGGRIVDQGYRGERVRIAIDEERPRADAVDAHAEQEEEETEDAERLRRRSS